MITIKVLHDDADSRLDRWFKRHYPQVPFSIIARLIRKGQIKLNGKKADISTRIQENDELSFKEFSEEFLNSPKPENNYISRDKKLEYLIKDILASVIYKDNDILVINKPAGLAVQGGTKIRYCLDDLTPHLQFDAEIKPKLVHRLDRETSGIIILARNHRAAKDLANMFAKRNISKSYIALVNGCPRPFEGKIDLPLEKLHSGKIERMEKSDSGKKAITKYRVLDHAADRAALVEFDLITGRTHQIRAHISMIGHPIIGDDKYGNSEETIAGLDHNLFLHSRSVSFRFHDKNYNFDAPLPKHFREALKELGLSER